MNNMATDWDTCARMLGRALSRYNRLTNSAKLELISGLVTGDPDVVAKDLFEKKPFCYAYDVIQEFEGHVAPRSAEVHLHHAIAFGFLRRAAPGGTRSHPKLVKRQESTSHIALSPLGRAYRSAKQLKHGTDDFQKFLWDYALLECDFDMYGLLLKMSEENNGKVVSLDEFYAQFYSLKENQIEWMREKFPYTTHREQIQRNIQWVGRRVGEGKRGRKRCFMMDEIFRFEGKTLGHHYDQRNRWAEKFRHMDKSKGHLTDLGRRLTSCLPPTRDDPFFWLGPPSDCAQSRFLSAAKISDQQCSPAWNLLRPKSNDQSSSISNQFIKKIAVYMEDSFDVIRLRDFKQASLDVVMPYVFFLEREMKERVDEQELFRKVFDKHRNKFVCTLRRNLSQSYYWLREK